MLFALFIHLKTLQHYLDITTPRSRPNKPSFPAVFPVNTFRSIYLYPVKTFMTVDYKKCRVLPEKLS